MTERKRINNVGIVGVVTLTGCMGFLIALFVLVVGLWIDSLIGKRGPATVSLLVLSVPLNLYLMVKFALIIARVLKPLETSQTIDDQEEV